MRPARPEFAYPTSAHVVGMAGERVGIDEWTEVRDEAVVPDDELVELTSRREVLVVEHVPAAEAVEQLGLQRGERGFARREEPREPGEAVFEVGRGRGLHDQRCAARARSGPTKLAPPAGFEPATHGLGNRRSIP